MKLNKMSIEELEQLSYTDLTFMILKEENKTMSTPAIFKKICKLLGYSDEDFSEKIGDYYTSLTIDKRFLMLENGEWDIRDNHSIEISLEDDEEEISTEEDEEASEEETAEEEDIDAVVDEELEDVEEDIDDLAVLDEEELDEEE